MSGYHTVLMVEKIKAKAVAKNFTCDKLELQMPSAAWAKEFTELIVRDVLVICDAVSEPFGDPEMDKNIPGALVVAEMIRENFGVEE